MTVFYFSIFAGTAKGWVVQIGSVPKGVPFLCTVTTIFIISAPSGQVTITLTLEAPDGADVVRYTDSSPANVCFAIHVIE